MQRNHVFAAVLFGVTALILGVASAGPSGQVQASPESAGPVPITVYRNPSCSCCKAWVSHLKTNGFQVEDIVTPDVAAKKRELGLPAQLASCHTGVVNGYVVEGHVPADDVKRLLRLKPEIAGLAVPGMPAGSPGMETSGPQDQFDVIAFDNAENLSTFNHYPAQ